MDIFGGHYSAYHMDMLDEIQYIIKINFTSFFFTFLMGLLEKIVIVYVAVALHFYQTLLV